MNETTKFVSAVLLFGVWGGFALLGKTPVQPFIEAIQYTLISIGIYHVTTRLPK